MKDVKTNCYDFDQYLSFKDLEKLDCWRDILLKNDEDLLEEQLFKHGCDLKYGYQIVSQDHTTRTNPRIAHFGPRILFKERTDEDWINNYMAIEDVSRVHPSSTVRTGMRESLNNGVNLNDLIEEQLSTHAKLLDIKHEEKEKKGKE